MSFYRNRYFLFGLLLILLGLQFRRVESFVLNEPATRMAAKITKTPIPGDDDVIVQSLDPPITKRVTPPRWLGSCMIAVGSIVTLHALAIPKHGG
jgi:hypothetical protein